MTGAFEKDGTSIVFERIHYSFATMIRPEGLLRGSFHVLDSIRGQDYHLSVMEDVVA
jgi:hypothetical protein